MSIISQTINYTASYNNKKLFFLFIFAFILRAGTFYFYTQHHERYIQPDTFDYHNCTVCLKKTGGLVRSDNHKPIFWRTPGYPLYLLPFYKYADTNQLAFNNYTSAHKQALWLQVFLSSLAPLIIFFLALILLGSISLSWLAAFIFAIHPGFVLASGFMLTEALSVLFFYVFLVFLYRGYRMWGQNESTQTYTDLIIAACALSVYTWMRPMGQFVGMIALLLLVLSCVRWPKKLKQCALFAILFLGSLVPWAVRNYNHTGHFFFWPGSGTYLACFNVPKLKRHITGRPLAECWKATMKDVNVAVKIETALQNIQEHPKAVSQELVASNIMWPWMRAYPWWALQDWVQEVCKTALDLYSYQLVSLHNGTFKTDPLEEFLTEKTAACLYAQPLPWYTRAICWIEFLFSILVWIGLWMGFFKFIVLGALKKLRVPPLEHKLFFVWISTGLMIGAVVCMTGGFGYARLRMPVEPLMIILSLSYWFYLMGLLQNKPLKMNT